MGDKSPAEAVKAESPAKVGLVEDGGKGGDEIEPVQDGQPGEVAGKGESDQQKSGDDPEEMDNDLEQLAETAAVAMEMATNYTNKAGSFFSTMFQTAAKRVENTYEKAKHEMRSENIKSQIKQSQNFFTVAGAGASPDNPLAEDPKAETEEIRSIWTGQKPIMSFLHPVALDVFLLSEENLCVYAVNGTKLHEVALGQVEKVEGTDEDNSDGTPQPTATCGMYVRASDELFVGCSDAIVRIFSCGEDSSLCKEVRQSPKLIESTRGIWLCCLDLVGDDAAVIGFSDGSVRKYDLKTFKEQGVVHPPPPCDSSDPAPSVTALQSAGKNKVFVGYADGVISTIDLGSKSHEIYSAVHAETTCSMVCSVGGLLQVSSGSSEDGFSIQSPSHGRLLGRAVTGFKVTSMCPVPSIAKDGDANYQEFSLIVGGEEGRVVVYRILPYSAHRVGFRILADLGKRLRGAGSNVRSVRYEEGSGMVLASLADGTVKMWRLSVLDRMEIGSWKGAKKEDIEKAEKTLKQTDKTPFKVSTRVSAAEYTVSAQKVLAMVLQEDVKLDDAQKDELVEEFQRLQSDAQEAAVKYDKDFESRVSEILSQFHGCLVADVSKDKKALWKTEMWKAGARAANAEFLSAQNQHSTRINKLLASLIETFGEVILDSLELLPTADAAVAAREAASNLIKTASLTA